MTMKSSHDSFYWWCQTEFVDSSVSLAFILVLAVPLTQQPLGSQCILATWKKSARSKESRRLIKFNYYFQSVVVCTSYCTRPHMAGLSPTDNLPDTTFISSTILIPETINMILTCTWIQTTGYGYSMNPSYRSYKPELLGLQSESLKRRIICGHHLNSFQTRRFDLIAYLHGSSQSCAQYTQKS